MPESLRLNVRSLAGQEFFKVYAAASRRQQFTRAYVRKALETLDHGFSAFDRNLIYYASLVNDAYDCWYKAWAKAVQVSLTCSICNKNPQAFLHTCTFSITATMI